MDHCQDQSFVSASYGSCAGCGEDLMPGLRLFPDGGGGKLCEGCYMAGHEVRTLTDVTLVSWGLGMGLPWPGEGGLREQAGH